MRRWPIISVLFLALGGLSAVAGYEMGPPRAAAWREIAWPFLRDGWPAGRAFRCGRAECGADVEVYLRPKLGFCNCDSGVADDDEVDRVADLDLISAKFVPTEAGTVVHVADMAGRSRSYDLKMYDGAQHAAVGIALSHRCDLLVAVAQGGAAPSELQREALEYLASGEMHQWMVASLGGR